MLFIYFKILIGLSSEEAKNQVQDWKTKVNDYEKKKGSINTLNRQKSNEIFQELMKTISDGTEGGKYSGKYMYEVSLIIVLYNCYLCRHLVSLFSDMTVVHKSYR